MPRLSEDVRGHLRFLAYYVGNGTLQVEGLPWVDYAHVLSSVGAGSVMEQLFAIWSNVLDVDPSGIVLNQQAAHQRAAQFLRRQVDPTYVVDPPFEEWEIALHL